MAGEELLAAPELVENLIDNINLLITLFKATGLLVVAYVAFSVSRWWTVRKEFIILKKMDKDIKKIKVKLKINK